MMEEELMPELVALVLDHVDRLGLVVCCFVCTTWMTRMCSSNLLCEAHLH
jgi:hypothetical protein